MNTLKVLLADEHENFRRVLVPFLNAQNGVQVVGVADDCEEAVRKTESLQPDLVLLDPHMARQNGIDASRNIKNRFPSTRVFILSMDPSECYNRNIRNVADGYISKTSMKQRLLAVLASEHSNQFINGAVAIA